MGSSTWRRVLRSSHVHPVPISGGPEGGPGHSGPGQSHTQDARPAGPGHGCLPAFSFIPKPGRIGKLYGSFPLQPRSPAEPASDSRRLPDSGLGPLAGHGGGAGVWEQPVSAACGDPPVQG
ncbi:uncharacterized protein [Manis javanica]|uniref:uncharacterized protein isoform X2 n=1 Tax=Manis javanica TaxID=9974 RepID=UPI003C6D3B00